MSDSYGPLPLRRRIPTIAMYPTYIEPKPVLPIPLIMQQVIDDLAAGPGIRLIVPGFTVPEPVRWPHGPFEPSGGRWTVTHDRKEEWS